MKSCLNDIEKVPNTIFDTIDLSIDKKLIGSALKDRMAELSNLYGRISELASKALFLRDNQSIIVSKVESLAAKQLFEAGTAVTKIKFLVPEIPVTYNEKLTTYAEESRKLAYYDYLRQRGVYAMKQIDANVNSARSMLSWDKDDKDSYK